MKSTLFKSIVAAFIVTGMSSTTRAENWPQWRGPRGDGVSLEKKIPTKFSKTEGVRWRTPMPGQAGATPCVWEDRVYVTSSDKDDLVLLCIDIADGKVRWSRKVGTGNQDARAGEGNSASPSPCTDGEHVWVLFGTGALACYSKEGNEVWKLDINERFGKLDIQFGLTSTPVLDGNHLYLQLIHGPMKMDDLTRTGLIVQLDKKTGKTNWQVERKTDAKFECKHSYASPVLYRDGNTEYLIAHGADCVTGHALSDGKELWRFGLLNGPTKINPKQNDPTFRFVASPGIAPGSDTIIVPTAKEGPAIALKASALSGESSSRADVVRWVESRTPDVSIPVIVDGLVYMLHKDGKLQCIELATGKELYMNRTYSGQHRSSPTWIDGHLYYGSNDGHFTVVKAGREFEIVNTVEFGEAITASVAATNGTLLIRSYDALYAIGE
jgi:outer membrane protein assembly factor BamB